MGWLFKSCQSANDTSFTPYNRGVDKVIENMKKMDRAKINRIVKERLLKVVGFLKNYFRICKGEKCVSSSELNGD